MVVIFPRQVLKRKLHISGSEEEKSSATVSMKTMGGIDAKELQDDVGRDLGSFSEEDVSAVHDAFSVQAVQEFVTI